MCFHALLVLESLTRYLVNSVACVFSCGLTLLTAFSINFCFFFLTPYMKGQQAIHSLFLKETLKEEKEKKMADSLVSMSQVMSTIFLEMLHF